MSCLLALTLISGYKKIESIANQHFGVSETIIQDKNNPVIFGFDTGNYHLSTFKVHKGEVLGEILSEHGIGSDVIHMLEAKAKDKLKENLKENLVDRFLKKPGDAAPDQKQPQDSKPAEKPKPADLLKGVLDKFKKKEKP